MNDLEFDKEHIWHPYTSTIDPLPVYQVKRAKGVYIELEDGRKLIDGMSSWWCAIHGYNNKVLNNAMSSQIESMSHIMFGGFTHKPAISLAKRLINITPSKLQKVFYSDSGSVAVEVAMKMALQYWHSLEINDKTEFLTIRNGYHGDTWHAMSVCDPDTGMHGIFNGKLSIQNFVDKVESRFGEKCSDKDYNNIRKVFEEKSNKIAAVILEPIVQGAGGMWFYSADYLRKVRELCDEFNVLLIADEIATGFGRTGELFACNYANIQPDIMCLGKAITGGYMSFAVTMATDDVANTISSGNPSCFMHGPTFMGNPLACSVACASIDLLMMSNWKVRNKEIEMIMEKNLSILRSNPKVADVRCLGAIGVVEMKNPVDMGKIQAMFVEEEVWVRPFGTNVYIMPQYIISDDELNKLCNALINVIEKY